MNVSRLVVLAGNWGRGICILSQLPFLEMLNPIGSNLSLASEEHRIFALDRLSFFALGNDEAHFICGYILVELPFFELVLPVPYTGIEISARKYQDVLSTALQVQRTLLQSCVSAESRPSSL